MTDQTWGAPAAADTLIIGSAMNALASGAGVVGAEVDNSAARYPFMDIFLSVDTDRASSGTTARIDFYLMAAPDGSNYPDPPGSTALDVTPGYFIGSIPSVKQDGTVTNFLSGWLRRVEIPPFRFKIVMIQTLGAAFPSNNNAVCQGYRYGFSFS